ncbi:MAG TPA: hypothetical protein VHZ55_13250 [Bryobacteraceae bacterium]|jgi:hypothetical protein|nr:hypothetical protein [Bryobacteraceae bacterium]
MNIPKPELLDAEKKCNILAEIGEDFSHVIEALMSQYDASIHVEVIRPVIGGGAGPERIVLTETERLNI